MYDGEFKKGMKHGKGKMTYPSGNYYDGEWLYDKKEGQGIMYWFDTNEKVNFFKLNSLNNFTV